MFQSEHGPSGFDGGFGMDELNLVLRGQNSGWPVIRGNEMNAGMYSPLKVFTPAIAPASVTFYQNNDSGFNNTLFVAALRGTSILIFDVHSDKLREIGVINGDDIGRIREIKQGPDNAIYFTTSNKDGRGEVREGDDAIYRMEINR
jgi:quinoprotein glucose dehydrogenase